MEYLNTTSPYIRVVEETKFGKRTKNVPNPDYIDPLTSSITSTPTINDNTSRLTAFEELEKKRRLKNDEMIKNLKSSTPFGERGGRKSRRSKKSRRSRRSRKSKKSRK